MRRGASPAVVFSRNAGEPVSQTLLTSRTALRVILAFFCFLRAIRAAEIYGPLTPLIVPRLWRSEVQSVIGRRACKNSPPGRGPSGPENSLQGSGRARRSSCLGPAFVVATRHQFKLSLATSGVSLSGGRGTPRYQGSVFSSTLPFGQSFYPPCPVITHRRSREATHLPLAAVPPLPPALVQLSKYLRCKFAIMSSIVAKSTALPGGPPPGSAEAGSPSWLLAIEAAAECAVSAAAFWCTSTSSVLFQKNIGVSCASKSCKLFGVGTVFLASSAAAAAAAMVRCGLHRSGVPTPDKRLMFFNSGEGVVPGQQAARKLGTEAERAQRPGSGLRPWSGETIRSGIREGVLGCVVFWMLGGRFFRLSPSCLLAPGAFHQSRLSLRATVDYASLEERRFIKKLGETFGCHTCGRRRHVGEWIADHQPPKRVVVLFSQTWLGRLYGSVSRALGGTRYLPQRFYPQCRACSNLQANVVKKPRPTRKDLVVDCWSVRPYHFTGGVLHFLRLVAGW
ncbi:hypothetical protein CSUI_000813 [Cystoisospora suis]|uniref:Transmembrane protein n=1 Tax=Cystoisospora suis TaxID=483139 RepID=A0A2C6LAY4_9APIC|nr:hypothetical protein CSUI_000813 [Cystoisospora suis]